MYVGKVVEIHDGMLDSACLLNDEHWTVNSKHAQLLSSGPKTIIKLINKVVYFYCL